MSGFRSRFPTVTPQTTDRDLPDIVFRICFRHVASRPPPGPPRPGCGGRGGQGQSSAVCPGCGPSWGQLDPRHAALGRVSAGRGAARPAGPGSAAGRRGRARGTPEGLGAGPGGRGTPPPAALRVLLATWRRAGATSRLASHSIPAGHLRAGARPRLFRPAQGGAGRSTEGRGGALRTYHGSGALSGGVLPVSLHQIRDMWLAQGG